MMNMLSFLQKRKKYLVIPLFVLGFSMLFQGCEEFWDPNQEIILKEGEMFQDWTEYRAAEMGLYSLQQNLVEQIVVLGELRGDLLNVTEYSVPDLIEVCNFNISKTNQYASPVNFYRLISASNNLIKQLRSAHPEVLDKEAPITNYDKLYGEAMCMRAWAYFNAVRIYGKVPYIHESLSSIEEIETYVNSGATYTDTIDVIFDQLGYHNDTIRNKLITLEKKFLDQAAVVDTFTRQLENDIKSVGVNHSIYNGDQTWSATVWSEYAKAALLGQMYLFDGDFAKAVESFGAIIYNTSSETSNVKFGLDDKFAWSRWRNIFTEIDPYEHILSLWFGKAYEQENALQLMFSASGPNLYQMKPTPVCIENWESQFDRVRVRYYNQNTEPPDSTRVLFPGIPGDYYRGYGPSYGYLKEGEFLPSELVRGLLFMRMQGNDKYFQIFMDDVDTVVTKFSQVEDEFSHDTHFSIFRAAGIHLYAAEIYALWEFDHGGIVRPETNTSLNILNDGSYNRNPDQMGVRGRVGFADGAERISIDNIIYKHDPITNEIVGYYDYTGKLFQKQMYLIDRILDERSRELAFEGERFYDLMRVAKRRGDPSYLADRVAAKFHGAKKEQIRALLMDESNWYVNYFD